MRQVSDEAELIRDAARRLFAGDYDLAFVRRCSEAPEEQERRLHDLIRDMGWQALVVPEDHGGVGGGLHELCALLQEHGHAAMPPLFFANYVAPVLCLGETAAGGKKAQLMESIAEGRCVPCVSADSATLQSFSQASPIEAASAAGSYRLKGTVGNLISARAATLFLVPARIRDRTVLFAVDADADSLELKPHSDKSFGQTHSLSFSGTTLGDDCILSEDADALLARAWRMCAVAKSAELIGGAERAMRFAVDHVTTRKQFGKYLAEFQAVQHQAADMLKAIEVARLFLNEAAQLIVAGQPFEMAAHNCKCWANQASFQVTRTSHQLMGGTGYMMETDLHLLTLQGLRNEYEFGSTDHHRHMVARLLGL